MTNAFAAYVLNFDRRVIASFDTRAGAADFAKAKGGMLILCVAPAGFTKDALLPGRESGLDLELPHGPMGADFRSWGRRPMPNA